MFPPDWLVGVLLINGWRERAQFIVGGYPWTDGPWCYTKANAGWTSFKERDSKQFPPWSLLQFLPPVPIVSGCVTSSLMECNLRDVSRITPFLHNMLLVVMFCHRNRNTKTQTDGTNQERETCGAQESRSPIQGENSSNDSKLELKMADLHDHRDKTHGVSKKICSQRQSKGPSVVCFLL